MSVLATQVLAAAGSHAAHVTVRVEPDGDIAWIVLDRPERLNALTATMCRELAAALAEADEGPCRVVVLRGEGRAFCAGADLDQILHDVDATDAVAIRAFMNSGWQAVIRQISEMATPLVAAVHGPAYGGGANLALAADLVVAGESAVFCQSYVDRGIAPDLGATFTLPRLVGLAQARRLLMLGTAVPAPEALAMGMIAEVVPDERLLARARELATELAAKDAGALNIIRSTMERNLGADLPTALARESDAIAVTLGRPAFRAGLAARHRARSTT